VHSEYKAKLKLADIFLDNFPYNCGSTTNDAINAGLPLVTRSGNTMVSRMGKSILNSVNVTELIAETNLEYINTCIQLSNDKQFANVILGKLKEYKAKQASCMKIPLDKVYTK
jgi:predicted O-linked N-acetylglucosamine transferase (SPINDLY family)